MKIGVRDVEQLSRIPFNDENGALLKEQGKLDQDRHFYTAVFFQNGKADFFREKRRAYGFFLPIPA